MCRPRAEVHSLLATPPEAASPDAATPDQAPPDTAPSQAGSPQAGSPQAGSPQAGSPQATSPQAASPQATSPQTGSGQAASPDAAAPEAAGSDAAGSAAVRSAAAGSGPVADTAVVVADTAVPDPTGSPRRRRRIRLLLVAAAVLCLAAIGLRGRLPDPREFLHALAGAQYGWVAVAAALQFVSLAAFALQQRRLLASLGVRLPRGHAMAITLARSALSITLPAGAAVSTGYAIREYQRAGATREIGAVSAIVSGLASIGGLSLLYLVGGAAIVARQPSGLLHWQPLAVVAGIAAATAAIIAIGRRQTHRSTATPAGPRGTPAGPVTRYLRGLLDSARDAWHAGATLSTADWTAALAYAAANWLMDLLCLAAATRAFGLPVSVTALAGLYLGVQIVRQVPLTPGGVGVIEAALVAGLTASGATAVSAAAAVLMYRLLSCWLIIPAGGVAALVLRRDSPAAAEQRG